MKKALIPVALAALLAGCQRTGPPAPAASAAAAAEAETPPEVVTHWTAQTELFAEYPPLVAGQTSRFAIHVTRLDNFQPVRRGEVEVRIQAAGAAPQTFRAGAPSRPGIFGVDVKPAAAGEVRLAITYTGEGWRDTHEAGLARVAASRAEARPETADEDGDAVTFLKEQQWTLDFATAVVEEREMRTSLRVPAEVEPRSGGRAEVDAPFDGRLLPDAFPRFGARVAMGQVLARVVPPPSNPADRPGLEAARREALAQWELARKDQARAERLVKSGAVPAKRVDEAAAAVAMAEARHDAAEARLAQYEAARRADGDGADARAFAVRAPLTGIIETVKAAPGANVKAGEALFQLVDLDTVYVSAIVPEAEFPRMRALSGAELEAPGLDAPRRLGQPVTIGRVVDAASRTFPVVYPFDNRDRRVAVNQTVYVRLLFEAGGRGPVIPESALVDDGGRPIVFVQQGGETFVRRPVKTGQRAGGTVQALEGVKAGERVVVKGAHLIRLASMSNQVPAHGHVH